MKIMNNLEEVVSYYVVNKELTMSAPKLAGQISHVATKIAIKYQNEEDFKEWYLDGVGDQTKIILRGSEKELMKLIDLGWESQRDLGRTEIASNSLTCVGLKPMKKQEVLDKFKMVKRLQSLINKDVIKEGTING